MTRPDAETLQAIEERHRLGIFDSDGTCSGLLLVELAALREERDRLIQRLADTEADRIRAIEQMDEAQQAEARVTAERDRLIQEATSLLPCDYQALSPREVELYERFVQARGKEYRRAEAAEAARDEARAALQAIRQFR